MSVRPLNLVTFAVLLLGLSYQYANAEDNPKQIKWVDDSVHNAKQINATFSKIVEAKGSLAGSVADLEAYAAGGNWASAQLLGTAYNIVGRYSDARKINGAKKVKQLSCPANGELWPNSLKRVPPNVGLLLINEDHLDSSTRANLIAALPMLKKMGFTTLAVEAISSDSVAAGIEAGSLPDARNTGVYLRDPLAAMAVRRAVDLHFKITSYEAVDSSEDRELDQASNLISIAARSVGRVVAFTGPGHVRMNDGWMGEYLAKKMEKRVFTIDQVSYAGADCAKTNMPTAFLNDRSKPVIPRSMATDQTLVSAKPKNGTKERNSKESWLTLDGARVPIEISARDYCSVASKVCLIEARLSGSPQKDVPADRYLAGRNWSGYLFVPAGRYRVSGTDEAGRGKATEIDVRK